MASKRYNIVVWSFIIALFLAGVYLVSKSQCENYVTYESRKSCPMNYRVIDDTNVVFGRNRCQGCNNDYDFSMYEYYCPHNCRQFGVSLCDQGKIM